MSASFSAGMRFVGLLEQGNVPPSVLESAARGSLSLSLPDRLFVLVHLAGKPGSHQEAARATIAAMESGVVLQVLQDPACPEEITNYFHTGAPDGGAVELERELMESAHAESGAFELVAASEEEAAALGSTKVAPSDAPPAAAKPSAKQSDSLLVRVASMSVPQRVQLALKGGRDERLLLVRDANKVVQRAVISSPRLTENDVEFISNMRNVSQEVLRMLAGDRRFKKSMLVVRNLVNNPRTPLDISLKLMKHLIATDLRMLASNKTISETVRRMAVKEMEKRG